MSKADSLMIFQKGFNYSQDGPGNRLVYHLCGCNMFCPWCSNPEGLDFSGGTEITVDEIVKEALSSRLIFIDGGGVTFTGGEVTCRKDVVLDAIRRLKENGISTCIETNASLQGCEELFLEVDYMIADFKSPSGEKLKEVTGGDIRIIKENLLYRAKTGKPLLIRVPLIKFFNCGEENAREFALFFEKLQKESENENLFFEILTYHEFGKDKYEKLGKQYSVSEGYVSPEDVKLLADEITKRKLKLIRT